MSYLFEVQRFRYNENEERRKGQCLFEHVGYINEYFRTKDEAREYYDKHHPHMRILNNTWTISDCDPKTKLRYIICNWYWELFCVVPWYRRPYTFFPIEKH